MDINEPFNEEAVDISTTDHTFTKRCTAMYCNVTGTVVVAFKGGAAGGKPYKVTQGQVFFGRLNKIIRTGTDAGFQAANSLIGLVSTDYEAGSPDPT